MLIIGCDYHPGFQQIAFVDTETGEADERRLTHRAEADQFYSTLKERNVRVGMEASGHARWFERLLNDLQFALWIGDAAEIRTKRVRKQKTDRQDAQLLLKLLMEDRFPRIWVPDAENRDLRQLLWHRHRLVQMRTRIMNQLHVVALNEGVPAQESAMAAGWSQRTGIVSARSLGTPTSSRPARLIRPTDSEDPRLDASARGRSGEAAHRAATDDASRSRGIDGVGLRVSDWHSRTFWLWQANRQLCGSGSYGGIQRGSATSGTYQQTRQRAVAVLAGGSDAGHGAQSTALAQQVLPPGHAPRTEDREGSDGPKAGGSSVLDVASGSGLRSV